ncbi:MAG: GTP-binding protein [Alphaproteobacteria bacterium]|jgi:G3E family GTPase|nr:GTP-binding protein [Alphaproteobacteria bacterium]
MTTESAIPVNIITGFLGSGKTTLLQRLLRSPQLANTAVLINEFGEVGLDHMLLEAVDTETVVLQSGCICCTIRGDLKDSISALYGKRERGEIPPFERLAIETTGLADPAPILFTVMADPVLRHHFRLGNVVTTVDAVNAARHMADNPESVKQVAIADRLVLTKTDLDEAGDEAEIHAALRALNPTAPIFEAASDEIEPDALIANDIHDPAGKTAEVRHWLAREADLSETDHGHDVNRHDGDIHAFCLIFEKPLDWTAFGIWLTMLLHAHGEAVLRVKGLLNVVDLPAPVAIHGVQHLVHPPVHLERWPDRDRRSRIVFIVRGLERGPILRSLAAFNRLAEERATFR